MTTPPSQPIRVMLVDDHAMVRRGLATFLMVFDDFNLVGEAESGHNTPHPPAISTGTGHCADQLQRGETDQGRTGSRGDWLPAQGCLCRGTCPGDPRGTLRPCHTLSGG